MTTVERAPSTGAAPAGVSRAVPPAGMAVVTLAAIVFLALCWRLQGFVTDDAWISVRYAENLAAGDGFGWNPGGPRAEGFSNPLLVLLEAAAALLGWSAIGAARLLGVLSGLACVLLVYFAGRTVVGETSARVAAVLTGFSAPFALWAVGGLETLLVAVTLTAAVLELSRRDGGHAVRAGLLLALLPWLRPEGLVVAGAVVAAGEGVGLLRRRTRAAVVRRLVPLAGLPLLSQLLLEAARWGIYGHLLPNSVLYKSGTGDPLDVLGKFVAQAVLLVVLAVPGVVLARRRQRLLAVPVAVYALGSIGTLDSANGYSRFFLPVWPQLALLAGITVAGLAAAGSRRPRAAAAALAAVVAAAALTVPPAGISWVHGWQQRYMDCKVTAREDVAAWLRSTPEGTSFAISDAGLVPARAGGRPVVDNFLLNDPLIQETGPLPFRQRADLVHRRAPDVLVLVSKDPDRFVGGYPTDQAIHDHPRMAAYRLAHVAVGDGSSCRYHLFAFQR